MLPVKLFIHNSLCLGNRGNTSYFKDIYIIGIYGIYRVYIYTLTDSIGFLCVTVTVMVYERRIMDGFMFWFRKYVKAIRKRNNTAEVLRIGAEVDRLWSEMDFDERGKYDTQVHQLINNKGGG